MFQMVQILVGDASGGERAQKLVEHRLKNVVQVVRARAEEERANRCLRRISRDGFVLIVDRRRGSQVQMFGQVLLNLVRVIDDEQVEDELQISVQTVVDGKRNDVVVDRGR